MTSALPPAPPTAQPPSGWPPPPPPPPGPPARPQLRRSRTDKVIGGVSGGLADYSGIDALLFRIGFVALTFAGGTGILVYLLLWLLMPAGPPRPPGVPGDLDEYEAPEPRGPRSPVPGVTIAVLLIVAGLLTLVGRFSSWDIGARGVLGAALTVVGLGLVAAAFVGGRSARGPLIVLGVFLSLALIAASAAPWRGIDGGIGDRSYSPDTAGAVRAQYDGGVGDLRLDLSDIDVGDLEQAVTTSVDAGIGDVDVIVPRDADVRVSVDSGIGRVEVLDGDSDGGFFPGEGAGSWVGDDEAEIEISINAGIGDVEVSRG
jgi:phage shock protein PspC (stress-responsive transcriptional regulator)